MSDISTDAMMREAAMMDASDNHVWARKVRRLCIERDKLKAQIAAHRAAFAPDAVPIPPLRYFSAEGETLDQIRDHARAHPIAGEGDTTLVWVNEGDLYNHSAPFFPPSVSAPVAVRVKPLEWTAGIVHWSKPLPGMKYVAVSQEDGRWSWWLDGQKAELCSSEAAAKAAAQADYAARIMAALEPHVNETPKSEHDAQDVLTPAPAMGELVEAAQSALNYIANTESELGIELQCGGRLRAALARIGGAA